MRAQTLLTLAALVGAAPMTACASSAPAGYGAPGYIAGRSDDGLLAEPPADAKAGQCFARVVVPGQPIYGPPAGPHLKWVQSPPPPGATGPVWCQVWEQGYQPTVSYTPERNGWIRVICDKDATRDRISHVQRRLHDWGVYQGGYSGQYDASTAEAVKRFQDERHIAHGGYLSFKTLETLDAAPPAYGPPAQSYAPPVYRPPVVQQPAYQPPVVQPVYQQPVYQPPVYQPPVYQPPVYQPPVYQPPVYQPPVYQPPVYQAPVYAAQSCPGACALPAPTPCGPAPCQGGYAPQGYAQAPGGYDNRRWLAWADKSRY